MRMAWHYTVGAQMRSILSEGTLRVEVGPRRCAPAVWFTLLNRFEPTAWKVVEGWERPEDILHTFPSTGGTCRAFSIREKARLGRGLYRIGVNDDGLLTFDDWSLKVEDLWFVQALEGIAQEVGSDVRCWRVSLNPVRRDRWLAIERWHAGHWTPLPLDAGADVVR